MRLALRRLQRTGRRAQRGAVAIVVGISMLVLVGMVGLAIDGGHLYLNKTELQNAADSCALAASYNLTNAPSITLASFTEADAAGRKVASLNKVGFQGTAIVDSQVTVEFSDVLTGGWAAVGGPPLAAAKYVRCTIERTGITPYFMGVMGFGDQIVRARATATLAPSQSNCAVPMALCSQGVAPDYGYVVGNWYGMDFSETGGASNYTGNFRWIDFDPSSTTPGCPGGGAQELACLLKGTGQCSLPSPITGNCTTTGSANPTAGCVGENGAINSIESAYNSRFGVYKGGTGQPSLTTAPPDFAGYAYSIENWTLGRDAYNGTDPGGTILNFRAARTAHTPTSNPAGVDPEFFSNPYNASTSTQHQSNGADRRLVVVPILDCSGFTGGQHAPIRAYACILMLDPYRRQGNDVRSRLEYLGLSNQPGSPCATSGITGNSTAQGPMVPSLVQ